MPPPAFGMSHTGLGRGWERAHRSDITARVRKEEAGQMLTDGAVLSAFSITFL